MKLKFLAPMIATFALASSFLLARHSNAEGTPQRIEIVAKRFDFTPGEVTLKKGVPVVLVLTSKDTDHGLKFTELNVDVKAKKGESQEVNFTPTQVGTFTGKCSVFCGSGHGSMKMVLHVTE